MEDAIRVLGLDIAAVHSGVAVIDARLNPSSPYQLDVDLVHEEALHCGKDFHDRLRVAARIASHAFERFAVDLTALEDYARRVGRGNTTAYEHAELCSLIKGFIFAERGRLMITSPTTMRSFLKIPPGQKDKGKGHIMDKAEEFYNFKSGAPRKGQRSNITDAYIHAVLGALTHFGLQGKLDRDIMRPEQERVIFGDNPEKKTRMRGLIERDENFYNWNEHNGEE